MALKTSVLELALARISGKTIYIDSCVFIYFLDHYCAPDHGKTDAKVNFFDVAALILDACAKRKSFGATGDAALAEVLISPYRKNDPIQLARFRHFFDQKNFLNVLSHDSSAFNNAAQIAAQYRLKLIDALHIATAVQANCAFFITNDLTIQSAIPKSLPIEVICLLDLITRGP